MESINDNIVSICYRSDRHIAAAAQILLNKMCNKNIDIKYILFNVVDNTGLNKPVNRDFFDDIKKNIKTSQLEPIQSILNYKIEDVKELTNSELKIIQDYIKKTNLTESEVKIVAEYVKNMEYAESVQTKQEFINQSARIRNLTNNLTDFTGDRPESIVQIQGNVTSGQFGGNININNDEYLKKYMKYKSKYYEYKNKY